jgi:hypothetical protein
LRSAAFPFRQLRKNSADSVSTSPQERNQDMAECDWRRPETYESLRDLDATGLAWEFLRRNPDYQRAYLELSREMTAIGQDQSSPVRHWGLSFRGRSGAFSPRASRILGILGGAGCRPSCSCLG